jgi:hypothetical protein
MSEIKIKRRTRSVEITLGTATDAATVLRMEDMAGAVVSVGTMSTNAASLQMFGSVEPDGPYRRVYGSDGEAADIKLAPSTASGRVYSLPDAVFAVPYLRIVSGSTNSTGTIGIVSFKS